MRNHTSRLGDGLREAPDCCSVHLIDGDGTFNAAGLKKFIKEVKLRECGLSYAVVSIMGPQSSGIHFYVHEYFVFRAVNWVSVKTRLDLFD
ncbi:hypothetical protein Hanom_Chr10g00882991 [Helianthus anomalus]